MATTVRGRAVVQESGKDLLADGRAARALDEHGYAVLDNVLRPPDLARVSECWEAFAAALPAGMGDEFLAGGQVEDRHLRRAMFDGVAEVLVPAIQRFLRPGQADVLAGWFQVKPPSERSEVGVHQDSALIDEHIHQSFFVWAPLSTVRDRDGAMRFLAGSHRPGGGERAVTIPSRLRGQEDHLARLCTMVEVAAGSALIWNPAVVHWSPPNRGSSARVAACAFVKPTAAPLLHRFQPAGAPNRVEVYEVDRSFFIDHDIFKRPPGHYRLVDERVPESPGPFFIRPPRTAPPAR